MADLVTHLCSGVLAGTLLAPRLTGALALGAILPDVTGRVPQMALLRLGIPLPDRALWALDVAHQPVAQILLAGLLAQAFRAGDRWAAFGGLVGGVALHFALDILQDHHGHGYHLLFPLSTGRWELGWIGSEATVGLAPWLLALTMAVAVGMRWGRGAGPEETPDP